jgi:hypothetical protein
MHVNTIVISSTIAEQACATVPANQYTSEFVTLLLFSSIPHAVYVDSDRTGQEAPPAFTEPRYLLLYIYKVIPYRVFNSPPLDSIPSRINPFYILMSYFFLAIYGSTALVDLARFFSFSVGRTPRMGISPSQGRYLHTEQHKQNKRTQTSMSRVGFEPTIPVFERAKTVHSIDSAATVIYLLHLLIHITLPFMSKSPMCSHHFTHSDYSFVCLCHLSTHTTYPVNPILFDLMTLAILGEEFQLRNLPLRNFLQPLISSSLLNPSTLLSASFSNCFRSVQKESKITVLYN